MAKAPTNPRTGSAPRPGGPPPNTYWHRSQRPLHSLIFLSPLLVVYELGAIAFAQHGHIYARSLLAGLFELLGVSGYYLPGVICVVVLLCLHYFHKHPWEFEPATCAWMGFESLLLAFPLFVFSLVVFRGPQAQAVVEAAAGTLPMLAGAPTEGYDWRALMVFSIGAGIYEELLFRLMLIALLHLLLVDVLGMKDEAGAAVSVVLSAVAFSLYHFSGDNPFRWGPAAFYTGAGLYFAAVYVLRGFGVVAGTHAIYDVLVVILEMTAR